MPSLIRWWDLGCGWYYSLCDSGVVMRTERVDDCAVFVFYTVLGRRDGLPTDSKN